MLLIKRVLSKLLLILFGVTAALVLAEGTAFVAVKTGLIPEGLRAVGKHASRPDKELGYSLPKNYSYTSKLYKPDGTLCYDAEYTSDAYGRRSVAIRSENPEKHLLLFGCSFTFGEGLSDSDTLQYQLQKAS